MRGCAFRLYAGLATAFLLNTAAIADHDPAKDSAPVRSFGHSGCKSEAELVDTLKSEERSKPSWWDAAHCFLSLKKDGKLITKDEATQRVRQLDVSPEKKDYLNALIRSHWIDDTNKLFSWAREEHPKLFEKEAAREEIKRRERDPKVKVYTDKGKGFGMGLKQALKWEDDVRRTAESGDTAKALRMTVELVGSIDGSVRNALHEFIKSELPKVKGEEAQTKDPQYEKQLARINDVLNRIVLPTKITTNDAKLDEAIDKAWEDKLKHIEKYHEAVAMKNGEQVKGTHFNGNREEATRYIAANYDNEAIADYAARNVSSHDRGSAEAILAMANVVRAADGKDYYYVATQPHYSTQDPAGKGPRRKILIGRADEPREKLLERAHAIAQALDHSKERMSPVANPDELKVSYEPYYAAKAQGSERPTLQSAPREILTQLDQLAIVPLKTPRPSFGTPPNPINAPTAFNDAQKFEILKTKLANVCSSCHPGAQIETIGNTFKDLRFKRNKPNDSSPRQYTLDDILRLEPAQGGMQAGMNAKLLEERFGLKQLGITRATLDAWARQQRELINTQ